MTERKNTVLDSLIPAICFVLALATVVIVYLLHQEGTALQRLTIVVGYIIVILIFFFGLMVLMAIATNKIDLSGLLCEPTEDKASMSRFQLLIFTFVIAFSLILIILSGDSPKFPDIPTSILTLLGISASTYAVSKGIQKSGEQAAEDGGQPAAAHQTVSTTQDPATGKVTTTVHNHSTGQSTTTVHDPASGQTTTAVHNPTTVTTTTTVDPPPSKPTV
jgi:hypothetical protein